VDLVVLTGEDHAAQKADHIRRLGPAGTVAIGNGFNDRLMLAEAALGLVVVLAEGAAVATVEAADVLFTGIGDALDALLDPRRLVASLRP
jgi:soluble P-type ATPase